MSKKDVQLRFPSPLNDKIDEICDAYGVNKQALILFSLWGVESRYGINLNYSSIEFDELGKEILAKKEMKRIPVKIPIPLYNKIIETINGTGLSIHQIAAMSVYRVISRDNKRERNISNIFSYLG